MLPASSYASSRGFTLIELLVVISIIGLLSSVALAALNTARAKGRDAAVISEVNQIAVLMELDRSGASNFANLQRGWAAPGTPLGGTCAAPTAGAYTGSYAPKMIELCNSILSKGSHLHTGNSITTTNRYSAMAWLPGARFYYCRGSSGTNSDTETGDNWLDAGCYANP